MLITISGLSGSGKSSAAKELARLLGIKTVDVGTIFRDMAAKHGQDVTTFGEYVEKHPEIDRELDEAMIDLAAKGDDLVLQGRLAGWLTKKNGLKAHRIWIGASAKVRAERIAKREKAAISKVAADTSLRDRDNRRRYLSLYGLDLNDLSVYDSVIQTDSLNLKEVIDRIIADIPTIWPKKPNKRLPPPNRRPKPKSRPKSRPKKPSKR